MGCGLFFASPAAQRKSETRKILNSISNSVFELSFELVFPQFRGGKLRLTQITQLFCTNFSIFSALNSNSIFRLTQLNSVFELKLSYWFMQVRMGFYWLNSKTQLNSTFWVNFWVSLCLNVSNSTFPDSKPQLNFWVEFELRITADQSMFWTPLTQKLN